MEPCAAAPFGSRTILNALRVALGIFSGRIILNIGTPAGVPIAHFHEQGRSGKRYLQRHFLRKCGAAEGALAKR